MTLQASITTLGKSPLRPNCSEPLRVLIVPDKFKGSLTATKAATAIAKGWRRVRPQDKLELLPMSDGGDGFGEVLAAQLHARPQRIKTVDAAHRPCRTTWWWEAATKTAIIESANVIGLAQLPTGKFHPFELDTFGLGKVLRAAADKGAQHCLVGIGGSATNDAGFGLARSLGWEFMDHAGQSIIQWTQLHELASLRPPGESLRFPSLVVAVDVQNLLLGARGCTRVYGPQKGLRKRDFAPAERGLGRLARVVEREFGGQYALQPGAGAAGGLGFGFSAFLGARLESGFELFAKYTGLAKRINAADLVLTGEGAIDRQTLMGKGVGQIGQWCRKQNIPCLAFAGTVLAKETKSCFSVARSLLELTSVDEAKARAALWLERLAAQVAREFEPTRKR